MSKEADKEVMKLRKELLKKKAVLLASEKPVYVAGEFFRPDEAYARGEFNVTIATESQLLSGVKAILLHKQSAEILSMSLDYLGFSIETWIEDFKTRKSVLDRSLTLKNVTAIEKKLSVLLSKDQLREIGIESIADAIKAV